MRIYALLLVSFTLVSCQEPAYQALQKDKSDRFAAGWHYEVDDGQRSPKAKGNLVIIYRFKEYPGRYFIGTCLDLPVFSFSDNVVRDWSQLWPTEGKTFRVSTGEWQRDFSLAGGQHGGAFQLIPDDLSKSAGFKAIATEIAKAKGHIALSIQDRVVAAVPTRP